MPRRQKHPAMQLANVYPSMQVVMTRVFLNGSLEAVQ
jgi:hypothetical protein